MLQKQIKGREEDLAFAKEIFDQKTQSHYKFLRLYDPLIPFLSLETITFIVSLVSIKSASNLERMSLISLSKYLFLSFL